MLLVPRAERIASMYKWKVKNIAKKREALWSRRMLCTRLECQSKVRIPQEVDEKGYYDYYERYKAENDECCHFGVKM